MPALITPTGTGLKIVLKLIHDLADVPPKLVDRVPTRGRSRDREFALTRSMIYRHLVMGLGLLNFEPIASVGQDGFNLSDALLHRIFTKSPSHRRVSHQ